MAATFSSGDGGAAIRTKLNRIVLRPYSPLDYSASGNGDGAGGGTNDQSALQNTINAASAAGGGVVDGEYKIYRCDTTLTLASNIQLVNMTLDFANSSSTRLLSAAGSEGSALSVSGSVERQSPTFTLTSVAGLAAGDFIKVYSNDDFASGVQSTEHMRIAGISGSDVTVYSLPTQDYVSGDSAEVREQNFVSDVVIDNVHILGAGTGQDATAFYFATCNRVRVLNSTIWNVGTRGCEFENCLDVVVRDCEFTISKTVITLMYGVVFTDGTEDGLVDHCTFYRCRHGVATGGGGGVNRNLTVRGCRVLGSLSAGLDMHAETDRCHYIDNYVEVLGTDAAADGIISQGARATICRNTIRGNVRRGIFCQGQCLATQDSDPGWHNISDNSIDADACVTGIEVTTESGATLTLFGVVIKGNNVQCDVTTDGIKVEASGAQIRNVVISGNVVAGTTQASASAFNLDSNGHEIHGVTVTGNLFISQSGTPATDLVKMVATSSNDIQFVTFAGNIFRFGVDCLEGTNEQDVAAVGNVFDSFSGDINSLSASNTNLTGNVTT